MNIKKIVFGSVAAGAVSLLSAATVFAATSVYNALPVVDGQTNYASLGFQATSTSEFGDYIHLGGTDRELDSVTVTFSTWARFSEYSSNPTYSGNSVSWSHPITVNVYSSHLDVNGEPDELLATTTQNVNVPWRPEGDPSCPNTGYGAGFAWKNNNGDCLNGLAFNQTFDLSSLNVVLPDDVIVAVAFNTQSYGSAPIGVSGPYNSLNVAVPASQAVAVGSDDDTDAVFWDTTYPGYTAGLREDLGWSPNGTVAFEINTQEPLIGPPTSKDECKNGGWMTFNNPVFKNQGQCVSSVVSNRNH